VDERIWTDRPLEVGAQIASDDCTVTRVAPGHLTLISGDLRAALALLAPKAALLGFGARPDGPDLALRIGRDHALLSTDAPIATAPGWQPGGFAIGPAGDGFACFRLSGTGAAERLVHGLAAAPPWGSPSAAVQVCGVRALVSGAEDGLVLWVEHGLATYISTFLRHSLQAAKPQAG